VYGARLRGDGGAHVGHRHAGVRGHPRGHSALGDDWVLGASRPDAGFRPAHSGYSDAMTGRSSLAEALAGWHRISDLVTRGASCVECGSRKHLHAHHVLPRSAGGTDDLWNLVPVCRRCHPTVEARTRTALGRAMFRFEHRLRAPVS
jgi:hypothetical protein